MSAAGVDPSISSTGIAVLWNGGYRFDRVTSKTGADSLSARVERMRGMVSRIRSVLAEVPDLDVIVIEGAAFGSKNAMGHMLGGFWWKVADALIDLAPVAVAQPSTVKKFATNDGSRKTQKPEMVAAAQRAFPDAGLLKKDHDVADAAALAGLGALWMGIDWGGVFSPSGGMGSALAVRWPPELMKGNDDAQSA